VSGDETSDSKKAEVPAKAGQPNALVPQQDTSVPQQIQILVDLEKKRIESFNRRTDVARYAIEMNDAADKRQFEYRMAELDAGRTASQRRHALARTISIGIGLGGGAIIALLLWMAFFGTSDQSDMAIKIFVILGIAIGGYGAIEAVIRAITKLLKDDDDS
jgi:hypothetical protein